MIKIILAAAAIFGLIFALIAKGRDQKIISLLMACALLLDLVDNMYVGIFTRLLLLITAVLSVIYSIKATGVAVINRIFIGSSGILFVLTLMTILLPIDFIKELHIAMLIPITTFILYFVIHKNKKVKELGFMIMWFLLAVFGFFEYWSRIEYLASFHS